MNLLDQLLAAVGLRRIGPHEVVPGYVVTAILAAAARLRGLAKS